MRCIVYFRCFIYYERVYNSRLLIYTNGLCLNQNNKFYFMSKGSNETEVSLIPKLHLFRFLNNCRKIFKFLKVVDYSIIQIYILVRWGTNLRCFEFSYN